MYLLVEIFFVRLLAGWRWRVHIVDVATKGKLSQWGARVGLYILLFKIPSQHIWRSILCQYIFRQINAGLMRWWFCHDLKENDLVRKGQIWRMVTPCFLHAGPIHLAVRVPPYSEITLYFCIYAMEFLTSYISSWWLMQANSLALHDIGPMVEEITGPRKFLTIYFTSALSGRCFFILFP